MQMKLMWKFALIYASYVNEFAEPFAHGNSQLSWFWRQRHIQMQSYFQFQLFVNQSLPKFQLFSAVLHMKTVIFTVLAHKAIIQAQLDSPCYTARIASFKVKYRCIELFSVPVIYKPNLTFKIEFYLITKLFSVSVIRHWRRAHAHLHFFLQASRAQTLQPTISTPCSSTTEQFVVNVSWLPYIRDGCAHGLMGTLRVIDLIIHSYGEHIRCLTCWING